MKTTGFQKLLEKRAAGVTKASKESVYGFANRLKKYESEFKDLRDKLAPGDRFYSRGYDI